MVKFRWQVFTLFDISARFVTHYRLGLYYGNIQAFEGLAEEQLETATYFRYIRS